MIKFDKLVDSVNIGIMILDKDLKIHYWNHWFSVQTHHHYLSVFGKSVCDIFDIDPANIKTLRRHIKTSLILNSPSFFTVETKHYLFPIKNQMQATSPFEYMQQDVTILPYEPESEQVVLIVYDQTTLMESKENAQKKNIELEKQKNIIYKQANYDSLTGLPNRSFLYEKAKTAIRDATRNQKQLALLFIDLDKFKLINDTMGHDAGDELLKKVAQCLTDNTRETDVISRLGGDEFIVLLKHIDHDNDVGRVAEKIVQAIRKDKDLDQFQPHISASIGISLFPENGTDVNQLMKAADIALYQAKDAGRNNFQFFTHEMNEKIHENIRLEKEIQLAIGNGDFELYFQPKYENATGNIISAEALVRWNTPNGLVMPNDFIPLAERTGLIIPLGEWIIQAACKQLKKWEESSLQPITISINLSPKQFETGTLVRFIEKVFEKTKVTPSLIEFEITESVAIKNLSSNVDQLSAIQALGATIALDDFGTGYSSLSYLKELPIDTIKIDKSFMKDIPHNNISAALTKLIIELSNELNLRVIAEGVENQEQKLFLDNLGCHQYQGFLFAKPMPISKLQTLVQGHSNFKKTP